MTLKNKERIIIKKKTQNSIFSHKEFYYYFKNNDRKFIRRLKRKPSHHLEFVHAFESYFPCGSIASHYGASRTSDLLLQESPLRTNLVHCNPELWWLKVLFLWFNENQGEVLELFRLKGVQEPLLEQWKIAFLISESRGCEAYIDGEKTKV